MTAVDMGYGWYFKKLGDGSGQQGGPYAWIDLVSFAQQGILAADDPVWHASRAEWVPAATIPGLFAQPQPTPAPLPHPAPAERPAPQSYGHTSQPASAALRPKRRVGLIIALTLTAILLCGGIGTAAWWLLGRNGGFAGGGPDLGVAEVKLPDQKAVIDTDEWGSVPANQLGVTLADGAGRKDAEALAKELNGAVVGEIEYINAYQIEFPGTAEADLTAALAKAESDQKVELAFPNQQDYLDEEIWGVRQDPYSDPIYGEGAGAGYDLIGVSKAWALIKGAGIELGDVKVGIVDDGLYKAGVGKESEFGGDVEFEYPDEAAGERDAPQAYGDGTTNPAGSHGTGIANVIAADPDNGGPAGIAGPLGKKLKVSMINKYDGHYGSSVVAGPVGDDPTRMAWSPGFSYSLGSLVAIKKQIGNKAKVINCSFGNTDASPNVAAAYKKFFEKMAVDHPDVLFVCSAGNDGRDVDGAKRFPSGHVLPNMITVGAVHNDGRITDFTNRATENYEVTLAAPGKDAVVGMAAEGGAVKQDGTSFAAPHVTAAAAILKSINPELEAGDLKRLLTESARKEIEVPGPGGGKAARIIPATVGGRLLAVDQAVFTLINEMRGAKGLPALTAEEMESGGVVDAVAISGEPDAYTVKGIVKAAASGGTKLSISVTGGNNAITGGKTQSVSAPGEATWNVTLAEGKGTITVTRADNGASSVITIDRGALEGTWEYPERMRVAGTEDRWWQTGAKIKMPIVRDGNGYATRPPYPEAEVTLSGDQVKIVRHYSGILPGEPGGTVVYTGTLEGDEIHGTFVDTYNGQIPWDAVRVK